MEATRTDGTAGFRSPRSIRSVRLNWGIMEVEAERDILLHIILLSLTFTLLCLILVLLLMDTGV